MLRRKLAAAFLTASLLVTMGNGVPDEPPPPYELPENAVKTVEKGEVWTTLETWDDGGMTIAVVDIAATPDQVMDAAMDLEARVSESGSIDSLEVYVSEREPERNGAQWNLSVFGSNISFSILYNVDRSRGWCRYSLDKSRENGIEESEGSYQVYPHGQGTRLVYRGFTESGRWVPGWIKKWLSNSALTDQLANIKARAESKASN